MLTILLVGLHLIRCLVSHWAWRLRGFSIYSGLGLGGSVIAGFLVLAFAHWPMPTLPLDLNGMLSEETNADPVLAWAHEEDPASPVYEIPPELYPDEPFLSQEPLLIAQNSLPIQSWGDAEHSAVNPEPVPLKKQPPLAPRVATVPVEGFHHIIRSGENLWDVAQSYRVDVRKITWYNPELNTRRLMPGDKVFIPGAKDPTPRLASTSTMILPFTGAAIRSSYGNRSHPIGGDIRFHRGVDMAAKYGTPVQAVLEGNVAYAGRKGKQGLVIELVHDNGLKTVYAHNRKLYVKQGQRVRQGMIISEVGSTGYTTGPHLHFEVWKNGLHQNPLAFLPQLKGNKSAKRYLAQSN